MFNTIREDMPFIWRYQMKFRATAHGLLVAAIDMIQIMYLHVVAKSHTAVLSNLSNNAK